MVQCAHWLYLFLVLKMLKFNRLISFLDKDLRLTPWNPGCLSLRVVSYRSLQRSEEWISVACTLHNEAGEKRWDGRSRVDWPFVSSIMMGDLCLLSYPVRVCHAVCGLLSLGPPIRSHKQHYGNPSGRLEADNSVQETCSCESSLNRYLAGHSLWNGHCLCCN